MSQQLSKPTILPVQRDSSTRINQRFDDWELIIERSGALLSKCEPVVLKLFLLLHLLLDLGLVFWIVLKK